jgi:hypothetical protein
MLAQDIALLGLARQLDAWEQGENETLSWGEVARVVAGRKEGLFSWPNLPSRDEQAESILEVLRGWGVDVDDPRCSAQGVRRLPARRGRRGRLLGPRARPLTTSSSHGARATCELWTPVNAVHPTPHTHGLSPVASCWAKAILDAPLSGG